MLNEQEILITEMLVFTVAMPSRAQLKILFPRYHICKLFNPARYKELSVMKFLHCPTWQPQTTCGY